MAFLEDSGTGFGAVDKEDDLVVAAAEGVLVVGVGDGDFDTEGFGEGGVAEEDVGEGAAGNLKLGVVDGGGTRGVGMDAVPVGLEEEVAGEGALGVGEMSVAEVDGGTEGVHEAVDSLETSADELLLFRVAVLDEGVVSAKDLTAFPEVADGGTEFSDLRAHVALRVFGHSCKRLWVIGFSLDII